jgi:hypothetical protein
VIAEVLDPKGLRKGMNRQDTNREDQKADDQLANFLFLHQAYKQYKAGKLYNARRTSMPGKQCPHSQLPGFMTETRTSLVSPSFA